MKTPGQPVAPAPEEPRGLALWGPVLRWRARAVLELTGVRHPQLRRLITDWYVRLQQEAPFLRQAIERVRYAVGRLAEEPAAAGRRGQGAATMAAACQAPSFDEIVTSRQQQMARLEADLRALDRRMDAVAADVSRSDAGPAPGA